MEKQDFVKALRTLGRTVAYYPVFSKIFSSSNCGVFISQMLYWEGKQLDDEGWIKKPLSEIEDELGFTRYEMDTIRKRLKESKVLEERKMGMPAKLHYRFDWNRMNELILDYQIRKDNPAEQPDKTSQPTLVYRMKEYFLEMHQKYFPELEHEYHWMEKDWRSLKLLRDTFDKRIVLKKTKQNPDILAQVASDDEIFNSFKAFIDNLPEFYRTQRYTPSLLYSDFNSIEQKVIELSKPKTNVNSSNRGNNTHSFAEAAKKASGNISGNGD